MIEAPLDDVLYVGQFIAVSVFEWLYFEGVIIQGGDGRVGGSMFVMFVSILRRKGWAPGGRGIKGKLSQLVYTKSVFIEGADRTGSVLFETGTFFCTKVIIKAQLLLIQGHYGWMISELERNFFSFFLFFFFFKQTKKLSFFA